ncbi:MFS transporter [Marinobacter oulmenensis]|uniref:MFS family permease n=1 Tax=Marinobacter oulmenensis TaxID=643747 RepID=A0A840UED5_9GAMM|nr:MFS transporter [Marinobacter oulmenensis]MBB5321740.1 MFS family permease [Marinobacter oulmenensis]
MSTDTPTDPDTTARPGALRDLMVVTWALTLAMLANTMLMLTVPLKALELNIGPSVIGLVVSAPYILPLILAIPMGGYVGRIGAKKTIIAGGLGMAAGPVFSLLMPNLAGLLITQMIAGMSNMVLIIAAQALISGLGKGKALERYFGWYTTGMSGGQLLGPLLAGYLIDHHSISHSFVAIMVFPLISAASAFGLSPLANQGTPAGKSTSGYRAQWRLLRQNRGLQLSMVIASVALFVMSVHSGFMPVYLEGLAISAAMVGVLISLRALTSMLVRLVMSRVIDWLGGRTRTIQFAALCVTVSLMLTGLAGDQVLFLAVLAIAMGVAGGLSQPLSMVILSESVDTAQRAPSLALRLMGNRLAQAVAPLVMGLSAELWGFPVAFALCSAVLLLFFGLWARWAGLGRDLTVDD